MAVEPQLADLIQSGDLKYTYKDFILNAPSSEWAAEAAQCAADQGEFWAYNAYLFRNQVRWNTAQLKAYARTLGLNLSQFSDCLESGKYKSIVVASTQEATQLGVKYTPTFVLNGKVIDPLANPYQAVITMVKAAAQQP